LATKAHKDYQIPFGFHGGQITGAAQYGYGSTLGVGRDQA
jgi:hypothetical protein